MVRALVEDAAARARLEAGVVTAPGAPTLPLSGPVDEHTAKGVLADLGIRTPVRRVCTDPAAAHAALDELGGPVVVKILDAEILHKTEVGGVQIGIRTHQELDDALARMPASPALLVEQMAPTGPELIAGVRRDPVFGPVLALGAGGTAAEILGDVSLRLAPLPTHEAHAMLDELATRDMFLGARGATPVDRARLTHVLLALSSLAADNAVAECEINPCAFCPTAMSSRSTPYCCCVTPGIKEDPTMREGFVRWPKEAADRYHEAGYWRGRPLGSYLHEWAETYGDAVAVVDGDTRLTYRQLVHRADGLACRLLDSGLQPGDAMLVQLPNGWEFVTLTLACLRAGIAPVMAMPAHRGHELRYLAAHAEVTSIAVPDRLGDFDHQALGREVAEATPSVRLLLVAGGTVGTDAMDLRALADPADDPAAARARLDDIAPDSGDIAVFLLSGGTTGLPKLITRTHDDYEYNARRSAEVCGLDSDTVYLVALPAGHNFPLACPGILGILMNGGRVVLARTPDPDKVLPLMAAEGVTATAAVPAVVQRWIDAVSSGRHAAPPALRLLQVGGARLAPEVARRAEPVLGGTLQQVFGMAEGLLNYTRPDDPDDIKIETQGRPMCPDDEILILDASDNPVLPGSMGALLTRGPYTPRGYYRADEHNARAFTSDGWYRTGDIVRLHPSGNLVVEGRDKDLINRGGEKISAEEVENLIYRLPGVARVAAVAKSDPDLGERVCVVVVLEPGTDLNLESVRAALTTMQVARYKLPEDLLVLDELPLTKVGKIDKKRLREVVRGKADPVETV